MKIGAAFLVCGLAILSPAAARADAATAAPGTAAPKGQPVIVNSRGGGFSVVFPVPPEAPPGEPRPSPSVVGSDFADDGTSMWMTGFTIGSHDADPNMELASNAYTFAQSMHGEVRDHDWANFTRGPGDVLPAYRFTAESDALQAKGLIVVDGRRMILVVAMIRKPVSLGKEADAFLSSLQIDKLPN